MRAEAAAKSARGELTIQENKGASEVAQAELDLTLAVLDRKKYVEGQYGVDVDDLKGSIALAQAALEEAKGTAEYYRKLVKKGFRTPEQLRAKEQEVMRAEYYLSRDQEKLRVLEEFTRERQEVELAAKAEEAKRKLARAKGSSEAAIAKAQTELDAAGVTAKLERSVLERLQAQLVNCSVKAPQGGIVVYGKDPSNHIELGALVHFKQKLFSLPDLAEMQIEAFVHESVAKKVTPGQRAEIRIDAYPNVVLHGVVEGVSTFYDPARYWQSGGVKDYATTVTIADLPDAGLKPGMTAEVKILLGELANALIVPIQAVMEKDGEYCCYVVGPDGAERRVVSVGDNNSNFIEVTDGLLEGELVTLAVRARAASESRANRKAGNGLAKPNAPKSSQPESVTVSQAGSL